MKIVSKMFEIKLKYLTFVQKISSEASEALASSGDRRKKSRNNNKEKNRIGTTDMYDQ